MLSVEARVARGAEWLDANRPGWEPLVDLDLLAMDNCGRCVLGQVFADLVDGSWDDGFEIGLDRGALPTTMGFDIAHDRDPKALVHERWNELRDAWVALIKDRHDTGNLSGPA